MKQTSRHFGGNNKVAPVGSGASTAPRGGGVPAKGSAAKNIAKTRGGSTPRKAAGVPASKSAV